MFLAFGYIVALLATLGSFWAMGGHFGALWQPFEFVLIAGTAFGAFVAANNKGSLSQLRISLPHAFRRGKYDRELYMQLMALQHTLLNKMKREGKNKVESDIEDPKNSAIFQQYPAVLKDTKLTTFLCDYLRLMITDNMSPHEIEALMDEEIETFRMEGDVPVAALRSVSDGLPAFGIVAAVLGVVKALAAVDQPPAILADLIAKAMVGTFLGIYLAYGFVGPIASSIERSQEDALKALECVKATLLAFCSGYPAPIAIEFGRKVLFSTVRPSFNELEDHIRLIKSANKKAA